MTAAQLRERCDDPWAPPLTEEWLREAFDRRLVSPRRHADLPAEWVITPKGRRASAR